jgi:hypothetical protein
MRSEWGLKCLMTWAQQCNNGNYRASVGRSYAALKEELNIYIGTLNKCKHEGLQISVGNPDSRSGWIWIILVSWKSYGSSMCNLSSWQSNGKLSYSKSAGSEITDFKSMAALLNENRNRKKGLRTFCWGQIYYSLVSSQSQSHDTVLFCQEN